MAQTNLERAQIPDGVDWQDHSEWPPSQPARIIAEELAEGDPEVLEAIKFFNYEFDRERLRLLLVTQHRVYTGTYRTL